LYRWLGPSKITSLETARVHSHLRAAQIVINHHKSLNPLATHIDPTAISDIQNAEKDGEFSDADSNTGQIYSFGCDLPADENDASELQLVQEARQLILLMKCRTVSFKFLQAHHFEEALFNRPLSPLATPRADIELLCLCIGLSVLYRP
jgi:hypothetical protein